jgi:hypothetical protein
MATLVTNHLASAAPSQGGTELARAAVAALMVLAEAIVATSYLFVRSVRRRWRARSAAGQQQVLQRVFNAYTEQTNVFEITVGLVVTAIGYPFTRLIPRRPGSAPLQGGAAA